VFFRRILLDVAVHPDYSHNGWIYLTTSDSSKGSDGKGIELGRLVRGHLRDNTWVDSQVLATQQVDPATGRIAFDDQRHVFVSSSSDPGVSEARDGRPWSLEDLRQMPPQDLKSAQSKVLRYNDDGTIPADNPFVATPGAVPAIWSYGHRNPQGLAFDHSTGLLWETEHGPRGGDELNVIHGGHNYGFPAISYGTSYNGITFTTEIEQEGMDQPVINWTPSIAVSAIAFYQGSAFPKWQHDLFVGSLEHEELLRVRLRGERAMVRESLLKDLGRIRAVAVSPQGSLYLAMELKTEGLILRLVPAT
jgi:aldose sugar dehydrogenase